MSTATATTTAKGATDPGAAGPQRKAGRPRDPRCDEAILRVTMDLVAERGAGGFTLDEVAQAAGCSKATIYRRWSSKEEMLLDVWRTFGSTIEATDSGSTRDDLVTFLTTMAQRMRSGVFTKVHPQMVAAALVNDAFATEYEAFRKERRRPIREIVARGVARGELPRGTSPDLVADMLAGPVYYRTVLGAARPLRTPEVERMVDVVLAGLRATGAP